MIDLPHSLYRAVPYEPPPAKFKVGDLVELTVHHVKWGFPREFGPGTALTIVRPSFLIKLGWTASVLYIGNVYEVYEDDLQLVPPANLTA